MKCPKCQHENPPESNFCLGCGARLSLACASCGTLLPAGSRFCNRCGTPVTEDAEGPARFASPESYTPKHLAEKILTSKSALEGERKQVTVLFADLKGSMELLADRDPEEARTMLDPVLTLMMDAVHRYEGTVNQVMGDGIMALFGAPLAHEDHAVRACYAALRMQKSVKRYAEGVRRSEGIRVQIRVGLNSGEVVVRSIGSDLHMDYTAVGQTTHLAARMEQIAAPGAIMVAPATLALAEGFVEVKSLGPTQVKGLPEPIQVFEIIGASNIRARFEAAVSRGLVQFFGRGRELERLAEALARANDDKGEVVAVVGEAGVGKSRLIWEFLHTRVPAGWLVLSAHSVSFGRVTAYLPIVDLLKRCFQIGDDEAPAGVAEKLRASVLALDPALAEDLPALLALLGVLGDNPQWELVDAPQRRQRIHDALKHLVFRLALEQPLLLVFEDLHWIDEGTQEILDLLVDGLPTARVLLVVNYRPEYRHEWGGKSYYAQIRLDPLTSSAATEVLESLLGRDPSVSALKRLVVERTQGNPFFMEETVQHLVDTGTLEGVRGEYRCRVEAEHIKIPGTVQAVLAARIDRLAPDDKRLLQAAAAVGRRVPLAVLAEIGELGDIDLRNALARLGRAELLYESRVFPETEYAFKHALTCKVTYAGVLHARRTALHAAILSAMERLYTGRVAEHAEALAYHAVNGEVWDRAVDYLREASSMAYVQGALSRALERAEQSLEITNRLPETLENARRVIDVRLDIHAPLFMMAAIPRLTGLMQEAEDLAGRIQDRARLGQALFRLSSYRWLQGEYAAGLSYAERAYEIGCEIDDPVSRIVGSQTMGVCRQALGDLRGAIEAYGRIVHGPDAELAKRRLGASAPPYILSNSWLAWCLSLTGDFDAAFTCGDQAIEAAECGGPMSQLPPRVMRSFAFARRGEFDRARADADTALIIAETNAVLTWLPATYASFGWIVAVAGRPAQGIPYLERAVQTHEALGIKTHLGEFYCWLAEALLLAGHIAEARARAEAGLTLARELGQRSVEAAALTLLANMAMEAAEFPASEDLYEAAHSLAGELGMRPLVAHCHLGLGKLYRRTGNREQAQEHLTNAAALYRDMDMRFWLEKAEAEARALA